MSIIQTIGEKKSATDTELFFALSEVFDEMYEYLKELYEINVGIDCEQYSQEELREFVENMRENADTIYKKWRKITIRRISKSIGENDE
jgi:hypothetical protein